MSDSKQKIKARIIAAAERVFARRGFEGATTGEIARAAKIPKANLHYYFGTKENLYCDVLNNLLEAWLTPLDNFTEDADPVEALQTYLRDKMHLSRVRADASRVFATEVINGGKYLKKFFETSLKPLIDEKSKVIESWIAQGKMRPIPPRHLFFLIWASTQTYADFAVQMESMLGKRHLEKDDFDAGENFLFTVISSGLGLRSKP